MQVLKTWQNKARACALQSWIAMLTAAKRERLVMKAIMMKMIKGALWSCFEASVLVGRCTSKASKASTPMLAY
jgi:hypothetical protein